MGRYKKLSVNILLFVLSNFGSKLVTLLLVPYYTYMLTTEQYGTIDLLTTTLSLIVPVITLSISDAVLRFAIKSEYDHETVFTNGLAVCCLSTMIILLSVPAFRYISIFKGVEFDFAVLLIAQVFYQFFNQFCRGIGSVKTVAISGFLTTLSMLILNIVFLTGIGMGVPGYFRALTLAYLISILFQIFTQKIWRYVQIGKTNKTALRGMLAYCIPMIPNSIMWWITDASDKYMIAFFVGVSSNGIYALAKKIPSILSMLHSVFFQAWQLSAVEESEAEDKGHYYSMVFNMFSCVMFLGISFVIFIIKPFLKFFVAEAYFSAWMYVPFLLIAVTFSSFSGFLGTNYVAMRETKGIFRTTVYGAISNVLLNAFLIPLFGMNGASVATCISYIITFGVRNRDTRKFVKINYKVKYNIVCISLIMLQIVLLFICKNMILVIAVEGLIFFALLILSLYSYKDLILKLFSNIRIRQRRSDV